MPAGEAEPAEPRRNRWTCKHVCYWLAYVALSCPSFAEHGQIGVRVECISWKDWRSLLAGTRNEGSTVVLSWCSLLRVLVLLLRPCC